MPPSEFLFRLQNEWLLVSFDNMTKIELSTYHRTTVQSCVVIALQGSILLFSKPKTIHHKVFLYLFRKSSLVFFLAHSILGRVWRYLCTAIWYATLILVSPVLKNSFAYEVLGIVSRWIIKKYFKYSKLIWILNFSSNRISSQKSISI